MNVFAGHWTASEACLSSNWYDQATFLWASLAAGICWSR